MPKSTSSLWKKFLLQSSTPRQSSFCRSSGAFSPAKFCFSEKRRLLSSQPWRRWRNSLRSFLQIRSTLTKRTWITRPGSFTKSSFTASQTHRAIAWVFSVKLSLISRPLARVTWTFCKSSVSTSSGISFPVFFWVATVRPCQRQSSRSFKVRALSTLMLSLSS